MDPKTAKRTARLDALKGLDESRYWLLLTRGEARSREGIWDFVEFCHRKQSAAIAYWGGKAREHEARRAARTTRAAARTARAAASAAKLETAIARAQARLEALQAKAAPAAAPVADAAAVAAAVA